MHDPDAIQALLEQHMIREFHQIGTAQTRRIIVMTLGKRSDSISGAVQFVPKTIHKLTRNLGIFGGDFPGVLRRSWMNDEFDWPRCLPSASRFEFLQTQTLHLTGIQFIPPSAHLLVTHPIMGFIESSQKKCGQLRTVWRGKVGRRIAEFSNLCHARKLPSHCSQCNHAVCLFNFSVSAFRISALSSRLPPSADARATACLKTFRSA